VGHPARDKRFILHTDGALGIATSAGGLGAVLMQEGDDGNNKIIAYASLQLMGYEKNYLAFLLEMQAALFGIEHFDVYLRGKQCTLFIDHKPLEKLGTVHKRTLNCLQVLMTEYNFTMQYQRGCDNAVADFLSRNKPEQEEIGNGSTDFLDRGALMELVVDAILDITDAEELVEMAQHRDEKLNDVREYLISKTLPTREPRYRIWVKNQAKKCFLENNLVWYKLERIGRRDRALLVVPEHLRERIIQAAHLTREAGHRGIHRTTERVQLSYWWPDEDNFIKKCECCQTSKTPMPAKAPLQSLPIFSEPNERIHIDLFTDVQQRSGAKHICVMTEAFSKYTEMVCIESKFADVVAKAFFERWICRFLVPKLFLSDQGREFDNKVMDELCLIFGVKKKRTSPYHPATNAQVEVYNKTIIKYMKAQLDNNTTLDWEEHIPALALAYNSHVHSLTRETSFYLTYLQDPRLPWFNLEKPRAFYTGSYPSEAFSIMQQCFQLVKENLGEAVVVQKAYFDRKTKEKTFAPGDRVMVWHAMLPKNVNQKVYK
jgi:hypothetical protein